MNEFTKIIKAKGWTAKAVAERWGVSSSTMNRICGKPRQKDIDALYGLPGKGRTGEAIHSFMNPVGRGGTQ